MALQQLSFFTQYAAWFKKPAIKLLMCICVAGLSCLVFYNYRVNPNDKQESSLPATKQSSSGGASTPGKNCQCNNPANFSLLPGRISTFLQ